MVRWHGLDQYPVSRGPTRIARWLFNDYDTIGSRH